MSDSACSRQPKIMTRQIGRHWPTSRIDARKIMQVVVVNVVDTSLRANGGVLFLAEFGCREQRQMRARMPFYVGVKKPEGVPGGISM